MSYRFAFGAFSGLAAAALSSIHRVECGPAAGSPSQASTAGDAQQGLPTYTKADVASHRHPSQRVWATYRHGVYDITSFIHHHPGGVQRIMLAAGGSVDKFWHSYTMHHTPAVLAILERYRIGNYADYIEPSPEEEAARWANEPARSAAMQPMTRRPFNCETPSDALEQFITPNTDFFVRNHFPVPAVDERTHCVEFRGEGVVPRCFPLDELKLMFPHRSVISTIECGGNRRQQIPRPPDEEVKGLPWNVGGIGNAQWGGVSLQRVLETVYRGQARDIERLHVVFEGCDGDDGGSFAVSVPMSYVMRPESDVLLATEMNGEKLPADHGGPVRAIVPGTVGVRNCKWLRRVTVQSTEVDSPWQQLDYKNYPPWARVPDPSRPSVYTLPIQSAITSATSDGDIVTVRGYAYCGGGVGIQRVEMSTDGGATYESSAAVLPPSPPNLHETPSWSCGLARRTWAWRLFEYTTEASDGPMRVCARAVGDDQSVQPQEGSYNFRGLLHNAVHCVDVVSNAQ